MWSLIWPFKLQAGQPRNHHLIPNSGKILHSPTHPYQLRNPPSSTEWVPGTLPVGIKWPWHEANHSPPSCTKIKNEWYCTSTHLHGKHRDNTTLAILTSAVQQDCPLHGFQCPKYDSNALHVWFQASTAEYLRTALQWVITQWVVVPTFRDNLSAPSSWFKTLEGPIGWPEMSVRNYHYLLCNNSETCVCAFISFLVTSQHNTP